jgi:Fic family protein
LEAAGLYEAMRYVQKLVDNNVELTEDIIKELHSLLYVGASEDFRGQYRTDYITIPHARNLPPVRHISYYMNKLFEEYNNEMNKMDIIEKISLFHIKFENIHPFQDGNGQVGRLIINYQLMRAGYPFISLKNKNKKEYIKAFESYHMDLDDHEMYQLIVNAIAEELEARIEILSREEKEK